MTWTTTLEVVDCASTGTKLAGAKVELGLVEIGLTNAAGRIDAVLDDFNTLPIFKVSKADYVSANFVLDKSIYAGTTRTVCLSNPPTIPDGQNPDEPGKSGGQEFDGGGCFIVSAATGSTTSFEVTELRALRDRVRAKSRLGAGLIEAIYLEYESFSPPIAAELHEDAATRGLVLDCVVRPLFAWYRLAGTLALDLGNQSARRQEAQLAVAEACPPDALADAEMIVSLLEALRVSAPLPAGLPPLLRGLVPRIAELRFVPWAILDPLIRMWRAASEGRDVTSEVADWLAAAPLERLPQPSDPEALRTELALVAGFLAFAPDRRHTLGDRLRAAWPNSEKDLVRAGFTRQTRAGVSIRREGRRPRSTRPEID